MRRQARSAGRLRVVFQLCVACIPGLAGIPNARANTASVRFACLSLRFHQGSEPFDLFKLDLSSLPAGINGELFPVFQAAPYTHAAVLTLTDTTFFEEVSGNLLLELPLADGDANGIPDFFQVEMAVQATSPGTYAIQGYGSGAVEARWSRAAGSPVGTCVLDFKMNAFQSLAVFTHSFELWEYRGTIRYETAASNVWFSLEAERTGSAPARWEGHGSLVRAPSEPQNHLVLLPGSWTNQTGEAWSFSTNHLFRMEHSPETYAAFFEFADGDPSTTEPDYFTWAWSVYDANDADHDGIPDLSDDPAALQPSLRLWVRRPGDALEIGVEGPSGARCRLQTTTHVAGGPWEEVLTVTLTNSTQLLLRQAPDEASRFWRVLLQ